VIDRFWRGGHDPRLQVMPDVTIRLR
jgi:hypothetical protein